MNIAIVGAGGFVGQNLIKHLVKNTTHSIIAITLHPDKIRQQNDRLKVVGCDVFDGDKLTESLMGCTAAVYLIHQMQQKGDWVAKEAQATNIFCLAAKKAKVGRAVYLSGLGGDTQKLSKHLKSRHLCGQILKDNLPVVIELRASIIIGRGSASYDLVNDLSSKLRVMILPAWAKTLVQPIALHDVMQYITAALKTPQKSEIIEIGGPKVLTYKDLLKTNAQFRGNKLFIIKLAFLPKWPAKYLLSMYTKKHSRVVNNMIESLQSDMIVTNKLAKTYFGNIRPMSLGEAFKKATKPILGEPRI